jgi:uncharacterized protein
MTQRSQRDLVADYLDGFRTSDHRRILATLQRVYEDGPVVVTTGEGWGTSVEHGPFRFAFNDVFTFRDGLIARVDSYVVPLP